MINIDKLFERDANQVNSFHDVVIDVYDKDKSTEELKTIFGMLPLDIQCSAVSWGLADTIFRDEAYEWLEKNKNKT